MSHRSIVVSALALGTGLIAGVCAGFGASAQPLPTDPSLVRGTLENGLSYIVRKNEQPPGRVGMYLHVSSGSLNETEKQRGIAHYLEHMAFNGSENFPPGSVIPLFQSMGMSFGQHQNAFTSFDQTAYVLMLPDVKPETIATGTKFLADVAGRLTLPAAEIEKERQIIIEEKRTRAGAQQRVSEQILPKRMPGSLIGQRVPIGVEETILGVQQQDFLDYYRKWYVPTNMTLMMVGDMPEAEMEAAIKAAFAGLTGKGPMPTDQDPLVTPTSEARGIVATDSELVTANLMISKYEKAQASATTFEAAREELVESLSTDMFNRRMQRKVDAGTVSFQSAGASVGDLARAARTISATATGKPEVWKDMLKELGTELQRACLHGFGEQEFADVKKDLIASAEQAVRREGSLPSQAFLGMMNSAIADGRPITSAKQDLEIYQKLMPTITLKECNERFARVFEPTGLAFIATLPAGADAPSEADVLKLGLEAVSGKPEAETEAARAKSLLASLPTPGTASEESTHEGAKVTSWWLSNGVRVHHRFMDYRKNEASISILIPGGEITDTAENRGVSQAANVAWGKPATSTLSSTQIRELMTGTNVNVRGRIGMDQMSIEVSGNPAELEQGMQLAHLMLTDPKVEDAALKLWKDGQQRLIEARKVTLELAFGELMNQTLYPKDEVRRQPLTGEQIDRVTSEGATAWLKGAIAKAPIEVSVVGEISKERAQELVGMYVGSLASRARVDDKALDELRKIERPKGPMVATRELATQTDKALFLSGFYGADQEQVNECRMLDLASRILSTRMIDKVREDKALAYSPRAQFGPGRDFPGFGTFALVTQTAPEKVPVLKETIDGMYGDFAKNGPTAEELATAKLQMQTNIEEQMREPAFWSRAIGGMDYRGRKLDDVLGEMEGLNAATPERVREVFAKYYADETRFTVWIQPTPKGASEAEKAPSK